MKERDETGDPGSKFPVSSRPSSYELLQKIKTTETQNPTRNISDLGDDIAVFTAKLPLWLRAEVFLTNKKDTAIGYMQRERAAGTLFHFAPLFFGLGISTYFWVPAEPLLAILLITLCALLVPVFKFVHHGKGWLMLCVVALFIAGMSAGKIRTDMLDTKFLVYSVTGQIRGTIIEVSRNQRGSPRYLIAPSRIKGIAGANLPSFIRASASSKHKPGRAGDIITGLARLQPVSGPAFPGSFDFSFNSWFNGLGGTGFFMGKPQITQPAATKEKLSFTRNLMININNLRAAIAGRIKATLPGENGDVAVALIIGDRSGIDKDIQNSLRQSGLAHVLAISGMHMALVSLTMVWAVRFLLALNMQLASNWPIKNWAAGAGFITASIYLAISGMGVATQRAWIMISVMILAAILSRKSITLRGVAIAALAILILQPESVLSPGFQMSFAAVAAIVAAYEWLDERRSRNNNYIRHNAVLRFFATLIFTSLIAGLATSLFAAYHFHRVAPLGVVTNLLAMPLISTIVMPMALLSVLLMPYGLEQIGLILMGAGIDQVISIAQFVNTLGGNGVTGQLGAPVLPMAFIGLFLLTMLKSPLRILGALTLMASLYFWQSSRVPDVILSEDGRAIAIKTDKNQLAMLYPRRNKFVRDIWLRAFSGDKRGELPSIDPNETGNRKGDKSGKGRCDKEICIARSEQGAQIYVVYDPDLLPMACNQADILLAPRLRWVNCRGRKPELIIKRGQLEEFGTHAIYLSRFDKQFQHQYGNQSAEYKIGKIITAISNSERPWNRHRKGRAAYRQD